MKETISTRFHTDNPSNNKKINNIQFFSETNDNTQSNIDSTKANNTAETTNTVSTEGNNAAETNISSTIEINTDKTNIDSAKTSNTDESEDKKKKRWSMGVMILLPYLFVCIGIALFSVFMFKEYIESTPLWRLAVNSNIVTPPDANTDEEKFENGEIIGGTMEDISLEPITKPNDTNSENESVSQIPDPDITEQIYYDRKDFPGYKWGELWAKLSIPAIGLEEKNVYVGESNAIYKKGIGKRYGTRFPGQGGNIVLGAHVTREFYDLSELKVGDRVYIKTEYGNYVYEIYETVIFSIDDVKYVMNYDDGEKLTLYTCHPRGTAYRTERYGVICKKISGPEWIKSE